MPARLAALLVASALLAGAVLAPAADGRARTPRLKAFRSCAGLISYARRHVPPPRVGPLPFPPRAPFPVSGGGEDGGGGGAGGGSSTTNVQEEGVDEPDIVKSDGGTVYALTGQSLHAVDARSATPRLLDSVHVNGYAGELLLSGHRALVIAAGSTGTVLSEVDVADPAHLRVVRTLTVDGSEVSARLHGHTARVVIASTPRAVVSPLPTPVPIEGGAGVAARRPLRARRAGWVPTAVLRNRRTGRKRVRAAVACDDVRRTPRFTGAGMVTVLTIDLERGLPAVDADAVMTDASTVYASPTSVYVATSGGWERGDTSIHRFDLAGPRRTDYRASGQVPGDLLNQFSMSERDGVLRAATTGFGDGSTESAVTTLQPRSGRLEKVGQVRGLGRGERIYAVRFIADRGYVVTFRQTDPLFTLDLSDPAHPRLRGELKLLGFSSYLHPISDHELLGIGQAATADGVREGTQLSLFDVSDPAAPRLLDRAALGRATSSAAEYDHHAFLWWAPERLAVVPVADYDTGTGAAQAFGFHVENGDISEAGRTLGAGDVLRTLVVSGRLFTLTDGGLQALDIRTLAPGPGVAFPAG